MIAGMLEFLFYNVKMKEFKFGIGKQIKILHLNEKQTFK
jgi:hypothetical protein